MVSVQSNFWTLGLQLRMNGQLWPEQPRLNKGLRNHLAHHQPARRWVCAPFEFTRSVSSLPFRYASFEIPFLLRTWMCLFRVILFYFNFLGSLQLAAMEIARYLKDHCSPSLLWAAGYVFTLAFLRSFWNLQGWYFAVVTVAIFFSLLCLQPSLSIKPLTFS